MISTEQYSKIKAVITDVDGVLTDCRVGYGLDELVKFFHYRDGHWIKLALRAGLIVGWLSGKSSKANRDRAAELGITFLEENVHLKVEGFERILERYGLSADECLYIGDDLIDMPVMRRAGIAVAVADAIPELDEVAHMRTRAPGGHGAVCEVIRELLIAQGKYDAVTERYYR